MKRSRLVDLHFEMLKEGRMPERGLCDVIDDINFDLIMSPSVMESRELNSNYAYFGSESPNEYQCHIYTPLRQNLLLLYAAYKGEL